MSMSALLLATRDHLKKSVASGGLALTYKECDITLTGMPHPRAGKRFVAIHRGAVQNTQDDSEYETYDINVTISFRINEPLDRVGDMMELQDGPAFSVFVDSVRACLVNYRDTIRTDANTIITASYNGFTEPFRFRSTDGDVQARNGSWWQADPGHEFAGVSLGLRFGGAMRVQILGSVT